MWVNFKNVNFHRAQFHSIANFEEDTFQNAKFGNAKFFDDVDFSLVTFQGRTEMWGNSFYRNARFFGAKFLDYVDFTGSTFIIADFRSTNFHNKADFFGANFLCVADFTAATFQTAAFSSGIINKIRLICTTFKEDFDFRPAEINDLDLRVLKILSIGNIKADLTNTKFQSSFLKNLSFKDCTWPKNKILYEEQHMGDEEVDLNFNELETIYRNLKQNMEDHGDYTNAGEFYYREMEMRRKKNNWKSKSRWWLELYRLISGYGEKPYYTALVSGGIILVFAILYGFLNCIQYSVTNPDLTQKIIDVLYFSFVTFTTLGLGDIYPITTTGKALICGEAIIGAFMIALFVVVFVRKMTR